MSDDEDDDEMSRDLDLLWLTSELAALRDETGSDSPVAGLRTFARRTLLRAQSDHADRPSNRELERLIVLLMIDRIWAGGGRMVWEMDGDRFRVALDAHTDEPHPWSLRLDVARPRRT